MVKAGRIFCCQWTLQRGERNQNCITLWFTRFQLFLQPKQSVALLDS